MRSTVVQPASPSRLLTATLSIALSIAALSIATLPIGTLSIAALSIGILLAAPALGAAPPHADEPAAVSDHVAGTLLTVTPRIDFDSAVLRVAGPDGYEAIAWSEGGAILVDLLADGFFSSSDGRTSFQLLPDGRYGYEAVFYLSDGGRVSHDGQLLVEGGSVRRSIREEETPPAASQRQASHEDDGELTRVAAAGNTDDIFSVFDALDDGQTDIFLQHDGVEYLGIENNMGELRFNQASFPLGAPGWVRQPLVTIETGPRIGIGTVNPQADLHIFSGGGSIRITDSDPCPNPSAAWEIEEDFGKLMFEVVPNCPDDPVGGKMWITGAGRVGIGTPFPGEELEIESNSPAIRLRDNFGITQIWDVVGDSGEFRVQNVTGAATPLRILPGTPTDTLRLNSNGRVGIGTGNPQAKLHVIGSGIIEGDVSLGSSRTLKHEIEPLDGAAVLSTIRDLSIYAWKYKDDPLQAPHVGPMAEDVHAAFRLGRDDKHLSPADSAGLALAAVKGVDQDLAEVGDRLDRGLDELRAALEDLASENESLRQRVGALERRLAGAPRTVTPAAP
jgi:hypothetical protein